MGRYRARLSADPADIAAAARLRWLAFRTARGLGVEGGADGDGHDAACRHVLIEPAEGGSPIACFRLLHLPEAAWIGQSYAARYYDLSRLALYPAPLLEVGRFCVAPGRRDPDILRLAWASITRLVDLWGIELMFGCSSFAGVGTKAHGAALALLSESHLAPARWMPGIGGGETLPLAGCAPGEADACSTRRAMPPLLRTYLAMGGWVSDHAVIDREMDTLHVFTGVEVAKVPPARARALRGLAG